MGTTHPTPARGSKLTVSYGLVNVGVKYAPLISGEKRLAGKYLDPATLTPVHQQYVNDKGEPVEKVLGYPHGDGFVVPNPSEIKVLELERDSKLECQAFVEPDTINPVYLEKSYVVWPDKGQEMAYDVLCAVLQDSGRVLVGTTVIRKSTKAIMLRFDGECLILHVCAYDQNMSWNDHKLVAGAKADRPAPAQELVEIALQAFSTLPETFDFSQVRDEYDERLRAAVETLAAGGKVERPVEGEAPVVLDDLMEALKATVAANAAPKKKATRPKKVAA